MLVRDCMTHHPVMIEPNMLFNDGRQATVENEIGHLPVVDLQKIWQGLISRSHFSMSLTRWIAWMRWKSQAN